MYERGPSRNFLVKLLDVREPCNSNPLHPQLFHDFPEAKGAQGGSRQRARGEVLFVIDSRRG